MHDIQRRGRAAMRGALLAALLAVATAAPAAARASTAESYRLEGYEVFYSPTMAMFAGTSSDAMGNVAPWYGSIEHSLVVSPRGTIDGGWASLHRHDGVRITGWFSGGDVILTNEGPNCTTETHEVVGALRDVVRTDRAGVGEGVLRATLTHHRAWIFGTCISYSASVSGSMEIAFD